MNHKVQGFTVRLWFALLGINNGIDRAMQRQFHNWRQKFWNKVDEQHASIKYPVRILRALLAEVGEMAWSLKDEIHIGARTGWIEGGHRWREFIERRNAAREHGKDSGEHAAVRDRHATDRADRRLQRDLYATEHVKAARKGDPLPKARDHVAPSEKAPPVVPKPKPACCTHNGGDEMACQCGCHPWNQKQEPDPVVAQSENDGQVVDIQPKASLAPVFQAPPMTGESMTSPANGSGGFEVTNTITLRAMYEHHLMTTQVNAESLAAFAANLREQVAAYEQAVGHLTADEFDPETIAHAAAVQERFMAAQARIDEVAADFADLVGTLQAARDHSLQTHTTIEEAVSGGAAKSTASYQGG